MSIDLSKLNRTRNIKGKEELSVLPCLALTLYSDISLKELAPKLSEAIKKYLDFIPQGTLRSCWVKDQMKKLTTQKVNRDLKTLEKMPKHQEEFYLLYSQGEFGAPGTHGLLVFADEFERDEDEKTNLLRMEFPWESAEQVHVEMIIDFVIDVVDVFPFTVGDVGFGFSFHIFDRFARRQVNEMLSRYLGFEQSAESSRLVMRGRSPSADWINLLDNPTLEKVGGIDALKIALDDADIRVLNGGVMIRSAKYPPIGDVNIGAPDIGLLPSMANFLSDIQFHMWKFRWAEKDVVDKWLMRFDGLDSKDWNNL
jgi:hypothetical protein